MFEFSYPKEREIKSELIKKIEQRFKIDFPPIYKSFVLNFNTSFFEFYPTINKWFKHSGLDIELYMSDEDYKDFVYYPIYSPFKLYNNLIAYPFAIKALKNYEHLLIGNYGYGSLFVGIGENNKDVIYWHIIENDEIVPQKIDCDIFKFISKYKITLPISSENVEKGLLEKYWLNVNENILLDMKEFEPKDNELKSIELDSLVDNIYNEIIEYVQS